MTNYIGYLAYSIPKIFHLGPVQVESAILIQYSRTRVKKTLKVSTLVLLLLLLSMLMLACIHAFWSTCPQSCCRLLLLLCIPVESGTPSVNVHSGFLIQLRSMKTLTLFCVLHG